MHKMSLNFFFALCYLFCSGLWGFLTYKWIFEFRKFLTAFQMFIVGYLLGLYLFALCFGIYRLIF